MLDIVFENITATDIEMPLTAYGDKDSPFEMTLKNIEFSFREGFEDNPFMHVANYKKIKLEDITVKNAKGDCLIKSWSNIGEVEFINLKCAIEKEKLVKYTDEEFKCAWI